jgi:hypothetical protein
MIDLQIKLSRYSDATDGSNATLLSTIGLLKTLETKLMLEPPTSEIQKTLKETLQSLRVVVLDIHGQVQSSLAAGAQHLTWPFNKNDHERFLTSLSKTKLELFSILTDGEKAPSSSISRPSSVRYGQNPHG